MDTTILNKLAKITRKGMFLGTMASFAMMPSAFAAECNEKTMDAFAYEDCIKAKSGEKVSNDNFSASAEASKGMSRCIPHFHMYSISYARRDMKRK